MGIIISVIFIFGGIGILLLIHACIVGRTLGRGLSESSLNIVDRGSFGSSSMSQDDIEKLPCFNFQGKENPGASPPGDCAVCLEKFRAGEKCRLLPLCNHSFHAQCVDLWLLRMPVCPICRAGADVLQNGLVFGGESGIELRQETGLENEPGNVRQTGEIVGYFPGGQNRENGNLSDGRTDVEGGGNEIRDRE